MDNWREDEEDKARQAVQAGGGSPGAMRKRYKKKLVEKMVLDDKGYVRYIIYGIDGQCTLRVGGSC